MTQLSKTLCYCREMSTDIITSLHPMSNFQPHKKKKMAAECLPLARPQAKQQQHPTSITTKPTNVYPKKNCLINCEVGHLYILQQLIVPEYIYKFYPVDLLINLGHTDHSKLDWIKSTCLDIYVSLNEAKSDSTHPVWSVVNKLFTHKRVYFGTRVYCAWDNLFSQAFLPVNHLFIDKTKGFGHIKFILLFFVKLKIDDRYGNG